LFPLQALGSPPRRILVLGGTQFLGPATVEAAVAGGHTVTLFNRGITDPDLFPHVEKLRGFRSSDAGDQDLSSLAHRHFDVVVDVWPNDPTTVASAAEFLKDRVGHYLYVSSIAAYDSKEFVRAGVKEDAPLEP
jgi:2'-hydroxyisoflavone reductase